jgi:hypothetical protein
MSRSIKRYLSGNIIFMLVATSMFFVLVPISNTPIAFAQNGSDDGGANGSDDGGANGSGDSSFSITNPLKVTSIEGFLVAVIEILLVFAIPIIVLYIMYAGFLFVTAGGESSQHEKARNALFFALIGGVIILGAFLIIDIIKGTVDGLKNG